MTFHTNGLRVRRLWTCSFGKARTLPPEVVQVNTAQRYPEWWQAQGAITIELLVPTAKTRFASGDWRLAYEQQIAPVLDDIYAELPWDAALLCWESDPAECHRAIAGRMLAARFMDLDVAEWMSRPPERRKPQQGFEW